MLRRLAACADQAVVGAVGDCSVLCHQLDEEHACLEDMALEQLVEGRAPKPGNRLLEVGGP
jgi:hypothetical protein